ncbi:hypothetical protein NliqN6_3489 [Naganishia liquefaciens]|uniref:Carboxylic ester hydrolase n=1 Tax=Naganishia liquefaciens TaxID=104408 RepID=A0A8H3YGC2_9TREE|nr:hypothetical protein NliqN6_3489 [Naganishia liquefaciens]
MSVVTVFRHPILGAIRGISPTSHPHLTQFLALPYAIIPSTSRFARSVLRTDLPVTAGDSSSDTEGSLFDATKPGPSSVQPWGSANKDAAGLQLPTDRIKDDEGDFQSEKDCLHLSITLPTDIIANGREMRRSSTEEHNLPVVLFQHGGAFFMGAGDRSYYSPFTFLTQALQQTPSQPIIFIAFNYRLGGLGFYHSSEAGSGAALPPNNGLHDQLQAYAWVQRFIAGFGGDPENITLIGQSAGSESAHLHSLLAIHANKPPDERPFRRSILFSGTPMCMPAKTPAEHEENFRSQAAKLKIAAEARSSDDILRDLEKIDVDEIRKAAWVGIPCSQSDMMPYKTLSMALLRGEKDEDIVNDGFKRWVPEQLVSACGYDGGISYNMLIDNDSRKEHAKAFLRIVDDVIRNKMKNDQAADDLLDLYGLKNPRLDDFTALRRICQFESDIGFFLPALAECIGASSSATRSYLQLFELGNPFDGPLEKEKYATHTWDIVALLGAYEDKMSTAYQQVIRKWREKIIAFVAGGSGAAGLQEWKPSTDPSSNDSERALVIASEADGGVHHVDGSTYIGPDTRRGRLMQIANNIHAVDGTDVLWNDVCRRFLMQGK